MLLLPSDSGGSWLCNVYMSTELTMATQTSGKAAPGSEKAPRRAARLPWSQRSLCWPGKGAECCRESWRSVTHHQVGVLHLRAAASKGVVCTPGVSAVVSSFPCHPSSIPPTPAVSWEDAGVCMFSELSASQQHQQRAEEEGQDLLVWPPANGRYQRLKTLHSIAKEHFSHTGCA